MLWLDLLNSLPQSKQVWIVMTVLLLLKVKFIEFLFEDISTTKNLWLIRMISPLERYLNVFLIHSMRLFVFWWKDGWRVLLKSSHLVIVLLKGGTFVYKSLCGKLIGWRPILVEGIASFLVSKIWFIVTWRWSFVGSFNLLIGVINVLLEDVFNLEWLIIPNDQMCSVFGVENISMLMIFLPNWDNRCFLLLCFLNDFHSNNIIIMNCI